MRHCGADFSPESVNWFLKYEDIKTKNQENITTPKENYNYLVTERNWVYSFYWEFILPIKNSKFKKTQRDSGK